MKESPGEDWLGVAAAAELLGLRPHTVYDLIDRGELVGEVTRPDNRPRARRSVRLRRRDLDDFLERARLKPGELSHLHPNWPGDRYRW